MNTITKEPNYYTKNGLSPNQAFEQGLVSKSETKGFYRCNIIKYLTRSPYKENNLQDLKKAKHYLELLIQLEEKK